MTYEPCYPEYQVTVCGGIGSLFVPWNTPNPDASYARYKYLGQTFTYPVRRTPEGLYVDNICLNECACYRVTILDINMNEIDIE